MIHLAARGIRATWEPGCGHLPELVIDGADILHRAPWRDDPSVQADAAIPRVDRRLGGTFTCAPFGLDDADHGPPHGLAANGPWYMRRAAPNGLVAECALSRGHLTARIALRDGHPVLYQTHLLDLAEPCSFAHHPMLDVPGGATLSTNASRVLTFDAPTQDGTALYLAGQDTTEPTLQTGSGERDWRHYPDTACDDFLCLVHAPGLAWTAVARTGRGDTILMLARGEQLPVTGLWLSNGARKGAPWNGRAGVLGVEAGRFAGADGFAAALSRQTSVPGPTVFHDGRHLIPHAIVRLHGAHEVQDVTLAEGELHTETGTGPQRVPFDPGHFA